MQIDVHGVDAEIARTHAAGNGVEVRAVAIEIGARLVHRVGDLAMSRSNRPQVLGLVSMIAATSGPSLASSASASTWPSAFAGTSSTVKPANAAVAGLVPCADDGTSTRGRFSPRASSAARIVSRPQNSPCAPAFGLMATAGMPVSVVSQRINSEISASAPCTV